VTIKVVCFASSFRLSGERGGVESPNISHAVQGDRTLCGRRDWATDEGAYIPSVGVDCLRCAKRLEAVLAGLEAAR
jgi:hypothetical protein